MPYDKTKISKKIASGGDRKVYLYGTHQVIKFSTLSFLIGRKLHHKLLQDYLICKKYLEKFVIETIDVSTKNTHIEIQEFIQGEFLKMAHMENPLIKSQLNEINARLEIMQNDGYPTLDLIGTLGMIKPCMSNILVDTNNNLRIIDTTLLEGKSVMPMGILMEVLRPVILTRQNYLMKKFLS